MEMMSMKTTLLLLITLCLGACTLPDSAHYPTNAVPVKADKLATILTQVNSASGQPQGEKISRISSAFLDTPYEADTLIGSASTPEVLVINFNGVDCFTLIDYVQSLSNSHDRASFVANLIRTRYVDGEVSYLKRRHFFSDWFANVPRVARDVTRTISPDAVTVVKQLNRKADGGEYVPGLKVISRSITYIPARAITPPVLNRIQSGDYIGVYAPADGLDVSHVGIAVRHDGKLWFRNASSLAANRKVVDSPFSEYFGSKPGIVVLRALPLREPKRAE